MRVAVVGAGIVGVTTAYELAALGQEVTVFERRGSVAAEASFANAGVVAAGYVAPWAAPGMPWQAVRHLFGRDAPVRFGGPGAWRHLPWLWQWWRACRPQVHAANRAAMQRLAHFSRERLLELTRTLRLDYDQMPGYLVLLRTPRDLAVAQPGLALLRELGVAHDVVDAARCRLIEPGLNPDTALHAAIHLPQDGVGNCRHFAHLLKAETQRLGARFRFETEVRAMTPGAAPQLLTGDGKSHGFDAVVVCAGVQANRLLASIGLKLPLAPIHGYSVTAPLRHVDGHPNLGPRAALMDEKYKVAITRLGRRVRVAGGAEIGGRLDRLDPAPLRTLYRVLDDWFPGAATHREAQQWKGARPMLPDGPPVLGESGATGIWLNLGHGSSGWAMACGSARVLAERVAGREAPLDTTGLTVARLR
ncbi:MAG: D-amino acid dehydrogenase [Rubrivivax sp.]|nr:D-amino acid dehydrogenase [Rubrivivax sp.]